VTNPSVTHALATEYERLQQGGERPRKQQRQMPDEAAALKLQVEDLQQKLSAGNVREATLEYKQLLRVTELEEQLKVQRAVAAIVPLQVQVGDPPGLTLDTLEAVCVVCS
jgi:predicted  nucleic acid-binding Zn-ribbon protein